MPKKPLVTVYIPSKNYANYLNRSIESVIFQTFLEWELILIDDGSTDTSFEVMKKYVNQDNIQLYKTDSIGLPSVCNFALAKANGKYILRLDGDDILNENALLVMVNSLESSMNYSFTFSDFALIDEDDRIISYELREALGIIDHYQNIPPHGACTLWNTQILREIGGYREDLGAQDGFDMWTKLKDAYKFSHIKLPLFYYRQHAENMTSNSLKIQKARSAIKLDFVKEKFKSMNPVTAIIPCRENYDFTKNLWSKQIYSKNLLEISIESCLKSKIIENIIVIADNLDVMKYVEKYEDRVKFIQRTRQSTLPSVPLGKAIVDTLNIEELRNIDLIFIKHIAAIFVNTSVIDEVISTQLYEESDSAVLVSKIRRQLLKRSRFGLENVYEPGMLSNNLDSYYLNNGGAISFSTKNLKIGSTFGSKIAYVEVDEKVDYFIDSEIKLEIAKNDFILNSNLEI